MRKNEPTASLRVAGPISFYDANGALKKNLSFTTAGGEVFYYRKSTNDWAAAANDATELGGANTTGLYLVQMEQAEVNYDTVVGIKLVKTGYDDQFWFAPIDNTPDVNVVSADSGSGLALQSTLAQILGLLHQDCVLNFTYSGTFMTGARIRQFSDATAAGAAGPTNADDADGEIHRWRITAVNNGSGIPSSYKLVQEL